MIDTNLRQDNRQYELYSFGVTISLTKYEKNLLALLCEHKGIEISSYDIFNHVWENETEFNATSVRTLVKKLRKKLPSDIIQNSYGGFYKLNK